MNRGSQVPRTGSQSTARAGAVLRLEMRAHKPDTSYGASYRRPNHRLPHDGTQGLPEHAAGSVSGTAPQRLQVQAERERATLQGRFDSPCAKQPRLRAGFILRHYAGPLNPRGRSSRCEPQPHSPLGRSDDAAPRAETPSDRIVIFQSRSALARSPC